MSERLALLEKEAHAANESLRRLYKLVEDGLTEMDDVLKQRIIALKSDRDHALAAVERARAGVRPTVEISPIVVERFGRTMRERLTSGEVPFRKAYLGSIVDRVEVDDREIRIVGRKDVLEQSVLANGGPTPGVRSFVRSWRAGRIRTHDPRSVVCRSQQLHIQYRSNRAPANHFTTLGFILGFFPVDKYIVFNFNNLSFIMAETGGFEPPVRLYSVQRFSKPPPSATRPRLQLDHFISNVLIYLPFSLPSFSQVISC